MHAWGQVVTFDADVTRSTWRTLQRSVNGMCGPADRGAAALVVAPDGFDARFSARERRYRYTVLNRPVPDPFLAATTWHVATPLDLAGACAWPAIRSSGEHDFASFCRQVPEPEASLVRRVH